MSKKGPSKNIVTHAMICACFPSRVFSLFASNIAARNYVENSSLNTIRYSQQMSIELMDVISSLS